MGALGAARRQTACPRHWLGSDARCSTSIGTLPRQQTVCSALRFARGRIEAFRPVKPLFGSDWGLGFMKCQACDYCDDLVGETADISVGDAWLPEYARNFEGTSVVIVRSPLLQDAIDAGRASGQLRLDPLPTDRVAASQAGGFRHRRAGLAARLANKQAHGVWAPPKRVAPEPQALRTREGRRALAREWTALRSHAAFQEAVDANDLEVMRSALRGDIAAYRRLSARGPIARLGIAALSRARAVLGGYWHG